MVVKQFKIFIMEKFAWLNAFVTFVASNNLKFRFMDEEVLRKIRELFVEQFDEGVFDQFGGTQFGTNDPVTEKMMSGLKNFTQYAIDLLGGILDDLDLTVSREDFRQIMKFLEDDILVFITNHLKRRDDTLCKWN